jgi:predicted MPP superfamily phosphohydrolase
MELLIVQLSDIHLKKNRDDNPVLRRAEAISRAVAGERSRADICFVVVSGDTAFSGHSDEYSLASSFYKELSERLGSSLPNAKIEFIIIPGNHDCNFYSEDTVRNIMIKNLNIYECDDSVIEKSTSVQSAYFEFAAKFVAASGIPSGVDRLFDTVEFEFDHKAIRFHLFNSAWMSQRRENPGSLLVPLGMIRSKLDEFDPADLCISVIHHPYNWFYPNNHRDLREFI